jgi:multidrug efflux pump subunit AcrB
MTKFLQFLHKNKLFIHYLTIITIIVGVASIFLIQREARPNVNFNRVNVQAFYPGASPSDIEELVIDPIEEKIAEVDGVEEYRSVSFVGAGQISITIDDNYPNPEKIVDELRRKISEVNDLPQEVKNPVITELKAENIPVLNIAMYGEVSAFDFKLETEKLKDFLQLQEGVQSVNYSGIGDLQLKVLSSPEKLNQFDLTQEEILTRLSSWAKQKPGGLFENDSLVTNLTIGKDFNEVETLDQFVIRSNDYGKKVTLSDVADIRFGLENMQTAAIFGDKEAVLFTVVKKPFFDSIRVVDGLKEKIEDYRQGLPPQLDIELYQDQSVRIRDKLRIVITNAVTGLALVLFILLIFLDWRSSIVVSVGIPVAVLGGIATIFFLGNTMNSLVVVGIIIVLGMLVDDAIVVCENIYSYIEKGMSPTNAAIVGTNEVALPVIASVLTTIFAFFPIIFMQEIIGQFLRVIPLTVVAMLTVSLLECLLILPIHAQEVMRPKKQKKVRAFSKIEANYEKYINWSIHKRWWLVAFLMVFTLISGAQGKKIFERFSLFPAEGLEGLSVRLELEQNGPLLKTKNAVKELSKKLIAVSEGTFDNIYSDLGSVRTGGSGGSRQNGAHLAMINVSFTTDPDFIYKEKRIMNQINKVVDTYEKETGHNTSVTLDRPGPPIGKPIQLQVTSRDFDFGTQIVEQVKTELLTIDGVHSIETDLDGDNIRYRVLVNNELAVSEGVDPTKISRTIFSSTTGVVASEILKNNEKIEILLALEKPVNEPVESLLDLKVRNDSGQAVPLRAFVEIVKESGPSSIQRLDGIRTITLFGEVKEDIVTGKEANAKIAPYISKLQKENKTISIVTGGGEKDRLKALEDTMRLYLLAIVLIFMTISLTFQSIIYPFLVLLAIPMGLSGVIWSLVLHGKSLSIMGIIGIIGLSGVVVNVSILLLKFIQNRLHDGVPFQQAIVEAGVSRLRPIIMTTISTLIGLLPTIYGVGGVDTFVQPIALVLGWGLFVAASMTLLFLPAIMSFFPILAKVEKEVIKEEKKLNEYQEV